VAVVDECECGGSRSQPNRDCERCRLVYVLDRVVELRDAQKRFFRKPSDRTTLEECKRLESLVDRTIDRLRQVQPGLFEESEVEF